MCVWTYFNNLKVDEIFSTTLNMLEKKIYCKINYVSWTYSSDQSLNL